MAGSAHIDKVDEGIADIAIVGEVFIQVSRCNFVTEMFITNAEIHEVISAMACLIEDLLEHARIDLVGDIAKHDL